MNEIDTSQLKILEGFFNDLEHVDQHRIFISAYKKATLPFVQIIKSFVATEATDKGNLWRSIGTKATKGEDAIWVGSILNTPYVKRERGTDVLSQVWYGRLTEGGTKERFRKQRRFIRKGRYKGEYRGVSGGTGKTGYIKAKHWFRDACYAGLAEVYGSIEKEWYEAINRMIVNMNARMK